MTICPIHLSIKIIYNANSILYIQDVIHGSRAELFQSSQVQLNLDSSSKDNSSTPYSRTYRQAYYNFCLFAVISWLWGAILTSQNHLKCKFNSHFGWFGLVKIVPTTSSDWSLTLSPPSTAIVPHANSLDPDETASNSPSHLDPSCLTLRQYFHQLWARLKYFENWSRWEI